MKHNLFYAISWVAVILLTSFAGTLKAQEFSAVCESGQTLYYRVTSNTEPYTVEVIRGEIKPSGNLEIPSTVTYNGKAYSVTSIGMFSFEECSGLTSINIPNSVTEIGLRAFAGCSALTSISIPNSVTSIGKEAFEYCIGLTTINIPNSVTRIGNYAFYGCNSIPQEIVLDIEIINEAAFDW